MNKHLLIALGLLLTISSATAQKTAKRELRGVWISTHFNLDWPTSSQTPAQQRTALISILDHHKATGMNVMYFQVRNQCDALYPSTIEPWSSTLTGTQGKDPGWDPLQFAIEETHKRGMELHAWLNPYRAVATASQLSSFVPSHVAKQHPEWLLNNGSVITLNPGLPAVRDYIMSVINDITSRYDVDGIHFDDYFYPPVTATPFNDDASYTADPRVFPATTAGRGDWRRDNINIMIKRINDELFTLKRWVKFGVSPTGIYRSSTNPAIGSNTSSGAYQHYSAVYADTKKWIQEAWVDYIAPQLYWYIGQTGSDYKVLLPWWNNQVSNGRHIYIGQAIYKVNDAAQGAPWTSINPSQIPQQMRMNRETAYPNVYGEIAFRTAHLRSNPLKVRDSIQLNIYKKPALLPTMPWRDNTPPAAPLALAALKQANNSYILNWTKPAATTNELDKIRQFVIYRSESPVISIEDTANLLYITPTDITTYTDPNPANKTYYYTITAVDRGYVESTPSNVSDYQPPVITCPAAQTISLDAVCNVTLPDYRLTAIVSDDVTPTGSIVVTQSPAAGTIVNGTGITVVTLTATDIAGKTTSCNFNVTRQDVIAPQITCDAPINVGTDTGVCYATLSITAPSASDNCGTPTVVGTRNDGAALSATYPKGTTTITWKATDGSGLTAICTQTITVEDREAPVITGVSADPAILFPPNHKMRIVNIGYTATDNCGEVTTTLSVSSNEAPDAGESDWDIVNNHKVKLRAERWGYGSGRIYTITITAVDPAGNKSTKSVTVTVPHDRADITTAKSSSPDINRVVSEQTEVSVSPNPSTSHFTVTLSSTGKEPALITVRDNLSRVIEIRRGIAPGSTLYVGVAYRPGVYYIEISQGKAKELIKVVKQ